MCNCRTGAHYKLSVTLPARLPGMSLRYANRYDIALVSRKKQSRLSNKLISTEQRMLPLYSSCWSPAVAYFWTCQLNEKGTACECKNVIKLYSVTLNTKSFQWSNILTQAKQFYVVNTHITEYSHSCEASSRSAGQEIMRLSKIYLTPYIILHSNCNLVSSVRVSD